MLPGLSGSLVSEYFAEHFLQDTFASELDREGAAAARAAFARVLRAAASQLGPVCGPRHVHDLVTAPLARVLGHELTSLRTTAHGSALIASRDASPPGPLFFTTAWGEQLDSYGRDAARASLADGASWCLCVNGAEARLLDARRSYARRFAQFDLACVADDDRAFLVFWTLLRSASFAATSLPVPGRLPLLDRVILASDRSTLGVCRSLQDGVLGALAQLLGGFIRGTRSRRAPSPPDLAAVHGQALTVIYRVLFLLFAESRRLVPTWHAVYRESYSVESLVAAAERQQRADGLWESLQAISRLSHAGCHAGDLRVTPFNGRLFSPVATPIAERASVDDEVARQVVLSLATTPRPGGRARIVYRDLDVEQLGAVYESVLDYSPVVTSAGPDPRARGSGPARPLRPCVELAPGSSLRKATASFYTPRALTTYLVRRTLGPLVADATPEQILSLRVLDPATGSGAFLVAACRFLAAEYASALVRTGRCLSSDIDDHDRRAFRRAVAQRCLYGVDSNPMAVQLARLSLWLATLSPDRPLTFLDHRLLAGDSLVGASLDDLLRGASGKPRPREQGNDTLPLFGANVIGPALQAVLPVRHSIAETPDDTVLNVREKERLVAGLAGPCSPLAAWKAVLDLWCAQRFLQGRAVLPPGAFPALADHLLGGRSALPPAVVERLLSEARAALARLSPFHWTLEFPEVFYSPDGTPLPRPGFDAVLGNPPWDMIRADNPGDGSGEARARASAFIRFARDSGIYRARGEGHANRFQLFVERAFQLTREGGRVGLVLPWGLLSDQGCAPLRRLLFDRATVDGVIGFDNADRIFPIHRSVRFVVLSATNGGTTDRLRARLAERDTAVLDRIPENDTLAFPIVLRRTLIERLSGRTLAIPNVRGPRDVGLLEKLSGSAPGLSSSEGWGATFSRELNATDDAGHFTKEHTGLPVLEGKHIQPFRMLSTTAARRIAPAAARRLLGEAALERPRLAYRDVSSATNRLTLIAAIVPARCVTIHTLFCLRTPLPARAQWFLCGLFNSLIANFFVRFWVSSHVTTGIIGRLPAPRPDPTDRGFKRVASLAARLSRRTDPLADAAYPCLQAEVARLYRLTRSEFEQILETFPLIEAGVKAACLECFDELARQP